MRRSKRFNAIVLIWGGVRAGEGGGWMRGSLQPVFNNFPRWRIPDLSVFGLKPDKWGKLRYSNSLVDALRAFRLKNQFRDD
jgi:hypothetical protein